jgi:glycosyltransferase involved in cell wall biosynthesis
LTDPPFSSVVHVAWGGQVGGIERLVHDLAVEQSRMGIAVSVAFGQASGLFADRIRGLGIRVLDLELRSGYDVRRRTVARAADTLARSQVVHAHAFNLPLGAIMRKAGRPIVFTHHGNFAQGRRAGVRGAINRRMQRRFLTERYVAVVANSNWTAEQLCDTYDIRSDAVRVVHNGIDVATFPVPKARDQDGLLTVAFVGRLVPFKRVDRIIRAVARLRPHRAVQVLIAGGGPIETELRALARELGVESQVRFLGWQGDVAAVLSQADVLVLPSEGEPFGLAMIEASAQGLLTVAFADGGGVLETVGPDGRVVHSVEELSDVLNDLEPSAAFSLAARQARSAWAREEFGIHKAVTRYVELYRSARRETE